MQLITKFSDLQTDLLTLIILFIIYKIESILCGDPKKLNF